MDYDFFYTAGMLTLAWILLTQLPTMHKMVKVLMHWKYEMSHVV